MKIAFIDTLGLTYDGDTLSKRGLGGSESAVILLSKELAKIGFDVTVYNSCIDGHCKPGNYDDVRFMDHSEGPQEKRYDICVLSRSVAPLMAGNQYAEMVLNSSYKVLWMHDTFCEGDEHIEGMLMGGFLDEIFTLSDFHSEYITTARFHGPPRNFEVLKHKFWQTRNGAVRYNVDTKHKDENLFVYNASATKGMTTLVKNIWPEIKSRFPLVKLKVIGGFYKFRDGSEPDTQEKMVRAMRDDPRNAELDIEFTGVISQKKIAEILGTASLMLYPTEFPETFGISTLESLLYNTPLVTNRFGALEETAIDMACYKIDYSSTNNALFDNIDEESQRRNFIEAFTRAVSDPYLLQQKREYCEVIKDIAGWDSVARQWKQHFYHKMGEFLIADEFRQVNRINEKVARIFGRRFNNEEERNIYTSYGPQKKIVVVSPFWNAENYIENHILSIAQQDYDNYRHWLIDDNSDDNSYEIAKRTIENLPEHIRKDRFIITRNNKNYGAAYNHHFVLSQLENEDAIVMLLDGDDWLVNNNTIFHYYNDLYNQGYDFTYGSMWSLADDIPLIAQDYTKDVIERKAYRSVKFNWGIPYTHLRTFSSSLIKHIDWNMLKDMDGEWMNGGHDNPLFYETIKSASAPTAIKEIMVNYNDINPLNDYKIRGEEQNRNAGIVNKEIQQTFTKALSETLEFEEIEDEKKVKQILIAIPTGRNIEAETFRSIYNLKVPEGYTTRFEYFFGYQIDQIRNLISDWAQHYDYLLAVDSDIVLPQNALEKMIAADKDIVSGIYIQRIPGTHTIEIFEATPNGGCDHISWEKLTGKGLTEVAGCGMGACLIKGEVFRKLDYPYFFYKSSIDFSETVSEDVFFCQKARENGFRIWADPSIICDHIGSTKFVVQDIPNTPKKSHLEDIADRDMLPKAHADYLKAMEANPKVVYDIGACVLHWTRKAKEAWPDAKYCLIDAAKSVRPFLEKSGDEWQIALLGDIEGKKIDFYEDESNPGGNSYYLENTGAFTEAHKTKRIMHTLDHIREKNGWPLPDLIKMDVQGAEIDVLLGAEKTLKSCKDIILEAQHQEYNQGAPKVKDVIAFMSDIGFELVSNFCKGGVDGDYHFRRKSIE